MIREILSDKVIMQEVVGVMTETANSPHRIFERPTTSGGGNDKVGKNKPTKSDNATAEKSPAIICQLKPRAIK